MIRAVSNIYRITRIAPEQSLQRRPETGRPSLGRRVRPRHTSAAGCPRQYVRRASLATFCRRHAPGRRGRDRCGPQAGPEAPAVSVSQRMCLRRCRGPSRPLPLQAAAPIHRVANEMAAAPRGLHQGAARRWGDARLALAAPRRAAGKGVAEVVQPRVVEPGAPPRAAPSREDAGSRHARGMPRADPRIPSDFREFPEDFREFPEDLRRRRGQRRHARPGLGVAQAKRARVGAYIVPARPEVLDASAPG